MPWCVWWNSITISSQTWGFLCKIEAIIGSLQAEAGLPICLWGMLYFLMSCIELGVGLDGLWAFLQLWKNSARDYRKYSNCMFIAHICVLLGQEPLGDFSMSCFKNLNIFFFFYYSDVDMVTCFCYHTLCFSYEGSRQSFLSLGSCNIWSSNYWMTELIFLW